MITVEREREALTLFPKYLWKEKILRAEPEPIISPDEQLLSQIMESLELNKSQAKAVACSTKTKGISLIQG